MKFSQQRDMDKMVKTMQMNEEIDRMLVDFPPAKCAFCGSIVWEEKITILRLVPKTHPLRVINGYDQPVQIRKGIFCGNPLCCAPLVNTVMAFNNPDKTDPDKTDPDKTDLGAEGDESGDAV